MGILFRAFFGTTLIAFGLFQSSTPNEGTTGTVTGVVIDANGTGIPDAKVYDQPMGSVRMGKDHFATTDQQGRFTLTDVSAGKTMIIATKTEAGYPDGRYAVFTGNESSPIVEVHSNQESSNVVVKLLQKGGVILGKIVDKGTNQRVAQARVILARVDHPAWSLETDPENDGTFEFVVPSVPMHITVNAEGFRTWKYEESSLSKNHAPLVVGSEKKVTLEVELERNN